MKPLGTLLIVITLFASTACRPATHMAAPPLEDTPRYALLSAFPAEMQTIRGKTRIEQEFLLNGRTFATGELVGQPVVLTVSGESMINAALAAQAMLDHFTIQAVIFSGIAGGVNPELAIGDVVIPAQWGQYQEQLFARQTEAGWDTGWHGAEFGNFGMMFPQTVGVTRENGLPDREVERFWFPVDEDLMAAARRAAELAQLSQCGAGGKCLSDPPEIILGGNGVSGQTFVDNAAYREWVWGTFQADALDMESAAVAQVAYANETPFIAVRSLSDLAGGGPGQNELPVFLNLAAGNSAQVLLALLQALGSPNR